MPSAAGYELLFLASAHQLVQGGHGAMVARRCFSKPWEVQMLVVLFLLHVVSGLVFAGHVAFA